MNFTKIKIAAVTPLIAFAVTACGGSSSDGRSYSEMGTEARSLMERAAEVGALNENTGEFENLTMAADMQTSGSASYSGVSGLWVGDTMSEAEDNAFFNEDTPDVLSNLRLTADFDAGEINGRMDNFQAATDDVSISGSVDVTNGTFVTGTGGEAGMVAELDGSLDVSEDGIDETIGITGDMAGTFLGDDGEVVTGISAGDMISDFGNGAFVGIWGADRD